MNDLFDTIPDPPAQRHSPTSVAAADAIRPSTNRLQAVVLARLREAGAEGLTDEEGVTLLGMAPNTYRPRRIELTAAGRVADSGRTRPTRSGRKAVVWVAVAPPTTDGGA